MCLAKAYLNNQDDEPVLQDISHMRLHGDKVQLESLFGEKRVVAGRVVEIDFLTSKVLLGERHDGNKA